MSVLDNAIADYKNKCNKKGSVEVPEWAEEGEELKVYFEPLTLGERQRITRLGKDDSMEMAVEMLILKSLDENGKKIFERKDKLKILNNIDSSIIERITAAITGKTYNPQEVIEEEEKN